MPVLPAEERTGQNEQHVRIGLGDGDKCCIEIVWRVFQLQRTHLQAQ
jgi:hypothetical protein